MSLNGCQPRWSTWGKSLLLAIPHFIYKWRRRRQGLPMALLSWSLQASMTIWPGISLASLAIQGQTQRKRAEGDLAEIHHAKKLPLAKHLRSPPSFQLLFPVALFYYLIHHLKHLLSFSIVSLQSKVLEGRGLCLSCPRVQPRTWHLVSPLRT